jgi:hypothetical protein
MLFGGKGSFVVLDNGGRSGKCDLRFPSGASLQVRVGEGVWPFLGRSE